MDEGVHAEESYATLAWQSLVEQRTSFVAINAIRACVGVATGILEKKTKGAVKEQEGNLVLTAIGAQVASHEG